MSFDVHAIIDKTTDKKFLVRKYSIHLAKIFHENYVAQSKVKKYHIKIQIGKKTVLIIFQKVYETFPICTEVVIRSYLHNVYYTKK